jgi:hypothetical protein
MSPAPTNSLRGHRRSASLEALMLSRAATTTTTTTRKGGSVVVRAL